MPSPASTVVGGIFSFPLIQLIELCFSAYSIAISEIFANFALQIYADDGIKPSDGWVWRHIFKAFTCA